MMPFEAPNIMPALPEVFLAGISLLLLLFGSFGQKDRAGSVLWLSVLTLVAVGTMLCRLNAEALLSFGGQFVTDSFAVYMKAVVIIGAAASLMMSVQYAQRQKIARFEYPVLVLLSTLGMMLMISANDLMSLYIGLELQSLPLYILAAMQRNNLRSSEAGLKYFILGALSSGILLYGASLIYGYTGTTSFTELKTLAAAGGGTEAGAGLVVGMVLVLAGLSFKISAVPFHMWAPDVYEGAPTSVTAFFAIAPKIAAVALITRFLFGAFGGAIEEWRQVVMLLSVLSMFLGGVAAIAQKNIKRMLAYSSIGHMGYILVAIAAGTQKGIQAILIYAALYMVMTVGVFCVVLMMKKKDRMVENISDLSGLAKRQPMLALSMAVLMFSMAGIPPLAGFFGKLFVFMAAVEAKLYGLAIAGVIASVISAYYYLRVIKVMYFDENVDEDIDVDIAQDRSLKVILAASSIIITGFIFMPEPLMNMAATAALSLTAL